MDEEEKEIGKPLLSKTLKTLKKLKRQCDYLALERIRIPRNLMQFFKLLIANIIPLAFKKVKLKIYTKNLYFLIAESI